jgi:hypothetical protein
VGHYRRLGNLGCLGPIRPYWASARSIRAQGSEVVGLGLCECRRDVPFSASHEGQINFSFSPGLSGENLRVRRYVASDIKPENLLRLFSSEFCRLIAFGKNAESVFGCSTPTGMSGKISTGAAIPAIAAFIPAWSPSKNAPVSNSSCAKIDTQSGGPEVTSQYQEPD